MKKFLLVCLLSGGFCASLLAADISVENLRARPSNIGASNSAIFMDIKNSSNADVKLVAVKSSICKSTELHTHKLVDGMKMMTKIDDINVPKEGMAKLAPGGLHVMLIGLDKPLVDGDIVDLEMSFDNGEILNFNDIKVINNFK
ncbi:copper chaperone PCu(A)C [Campylobacter sp. RM13119]|uniref:copper chaperone PCu(A)C n=1 Tax=Campylobacter californiensis TaxID=1032243 RepID=UPI001475A931|nr:copper chaperone PCu(A)C [Campylobacter sp. RM13119]MBE3606474.1 copper chaperone PCu(A)C [Campylobacter sp. RM13119]